MAFFCEKSGVRIVGPGVAMSAGGNVLEFDHAQPIHGDAESAARAVIAGVPGNDAHAPSPDIKATAVKAAETVLTNPDKRAGKKPV